MITIDKFPHLTEDDINYIIRCNNNFQCLYISKIEDGKYILNLNGNSIYSHERKVFLPSKITIKEPLEILIGFLEFYKNISRLSGEINEIDNVRNNLLKVLGFSQEAMDIISNANSRTYYENTEIFWKKICKFYNV